MKTKKTAKKFTLADKIVLVVNLIFVLALLLSYLAPSTDPRDYSFIAILGFGYQALILANVIFILYWLIRRKLFALISAISILLGFAIFPSYYKFGGGNLVAKKSDSTDLRIMEYNVHKFEGVNELEGKPSEARMLQAVEEKQPDIVAITEYYKHMPTTDTIAGSIKQMLNTGYYYFCPFWGTKKQKDSSGNAIFSKYPIVNKGYIESTSVFKTDVMFADISYKNKIFRVYCVHLAAVQIKGSTKYGYLNGKMDLNKSSFILTKLKLAFIERAYQVGIIQRELEKCPYPYIITGDFNDTPNSFSVTQLSAGLKNAFKEKGTGLGITYQSAFPKLQIDYILVNPQFDVLGYEIVNNKTSDHYPVVADLRLK